MDLVSALAELRENSIGTKFSCSANTMWKTLNDKERQALETVFADSKVSTASLYELLIANKYEVGKASLYKHRAKKCRCFI